MNDKLLILDECNNTPGFDYDFYFEGIPDSSANVMMILTINGNYGGSDDHVKKLQLFNYDTTSYVNITAKTDDMPNTTIQRRYQFNLDLGAANYVDNGQMIVKIVHNSAGNDGHLLRIDLMELEVGSSSSSSTSSSSSSTSSSSSSSSSQSFSSSSRSLGFG